MKKRNPNEKITCVQQFDTTVNDRLQWSFEARLSQASPQVKHYYLQIKRALLGYKKVSNRTSWTYDSFSHCRKKLAKLTVKGQTLYLYLALDASKLDKKYKVTVSHQNQYADAPCQYRIINEHRLKYALQLIELLAQEYDLVAGKPCQLQLDLPYYSTDQLIEKGKIKVHPPKQ